MYLLVLGLILLILKWQEVAPFATWSWWWFVVPFALTVLWWWWCDASGYNYRKNADLVDERKRQRQAKTKDALKNKIRRS